MAQVKQKLNPEQGETPVAYGPAEEICGAGSDRRFLFSGRLLTVGEVATSLHVHPQSVYRYVAAGLLPALRLTPTKRGKLRIRREDFETFLRHDRGRSAP